MKNQMIFFLLMSFQLSTSVHAQYKWDVHGMIYERWKDVQKESYKNRNECLYSYFTPDSTGLTDVSYDSLNRIERINTYYGNIDNLVRWVYDSSIMVTGIMVTGYGQNGPSITFYENQKVKSVENYFLGHRIGRWIRYFPNGEIQSIENYPIDSMIYSMCEEYSFGVSEGVPGGIVSVAAYITTGVPHGEWIDFYSNGNIKAKKFFYMGLEIGKWEWYYEDGIKKREGSYFEGYLKEHPCRIVVSHDGDEEEEEIYSAGYTFVHIRPKHGTWKYWDEKGNLIKEERYDQGKLIQPKKNSKSKVKK